jgi:hypothetical protein
VTDDDVRIRMASRVRGHPLHCILSTRRILQAKARHCLAGLNEMHMSIDKRRGD